MHLASHGFITPLVPPTPKSVMPMPGDTWWSSLNYSVLADLPVAEWQRWEKEMLEMLNNASHSVNDPSFDILRSPAWRGLILTLYVAVILVGMVGNTIVIFVVIRNRNMQNVTNILIANLAISDIGLCVFSLPIQLYYQLTDHWIFGEFLCRVIFSAFAVPMYVSTLTMLLIAYDRYWLIVYPLKERMTIRMAIVIIVMADLTSLMLSVPVMCFTSIHKIYEPDLKIDRKYCVEKWPNPTARKVYSSLMFTFQFCLPLMVTSLLYHRIYRKLRHRPQNRSTCERKQKTNKILIGIVGLFVTCWLPWNVLSLITEVEGEIVKGPHFKFVDLILKVFAMSSACINPFLYCWLNDNFRKELDNLAIKLHVYREPSLKRERNPYRPQPTMDDNYRSTTNPFGTITIERLSSANVI